MAFVDIWLWRLGWRLRKPPTVCLLPCCCCFYCINNYQPHELNKCGGSGNKSNNPAFNWKTKSFAHTLSGNILLRMCDAHKHTYTLNAKWCTLGCNLPQTCCCATLLNAGSGAQFPLNAKFQPHPAMSTTLLTIIKTNNYIQQQQQQNINIWGAKTIVAKEVCAQEARYASLTGIVSVLDKFAFVLSPACLFSISVEFTF